MIENCTEEQIANLKTLAAYLRGLPHDYAQFEMGTYLGKSVYSALKADVARSYLTSNGGLPGGCGTVACALGHGPAAHIYLNDGEIGDYYINWNGYAARAFGVPEDMPAWDWMFGTSWSDADNTPLGAAQRIDYYLANGVPEGFEVGDTEDYVSLYQSDAT